MDKPLPGAPDARAEPGAANAAAEHGKLRVALFSGNYNYVVDGPVRALNRLVAHLEARGHDVLVFAPTIKNPPIKHAGELVSIPSIALPGARSEYRVGLGLFGKARARLDAFAPNLIHIAAPDITGFQALKYAEKNRLTPVASFHTRFDTYPRYYGARWLEPRVTAYMRNFYNRCAHVYAPSESMRAELTRDGVGRDVRIWTRGVDSELFSPAARDMDWRRAQGLADDAVLIAFVGRLVLEKGIEVFAEAVRAAQATNPKIAGLIVGAGPERARFEKLLPGAVFVGYQEGEGLARAYASADVFFNPSITETFGNVTLEAMASGLPSVGAAASGSRSLIEDGATGLLSDPADGARAYAERLATLAGDADVRARMGAEARARSLNYNWSSVLDTLIGQYREAMTQTAPLKQI